MKPRFDFLVAGAGFSGAVLAERLASCAGKTCLVVDKRSHIGGNAADEVNAHGLRIHKYGPHYFRTASDKIIQYLSQFTEWRRVDFKILAWTNGKHWQFPINLNTFEQLIGRSSDSAEMEEWLAQHRIAIECPHNSEEVVLSKVGRELYEMFFAGYTRKQWGVDASQLDPSVCARIPIRTNRDDRYLSEEFQGLPKGGYSSMFRRMLDHKNITVELRTDWVDASERIGFKHLVYTGPIDEYLGFEFGPLPYRSLRFESEVLQAEFAQPAVQVNYPNDFGFTRSIELKHATGEQSPFTEIVREYPQAHVSGENEPYYPMPTPEARAQFRKYAVLASAEKNVTFAGRLAAYKYYNMDQVVGMALAKFDALRKQF